MNELVPALGVATGGAFGVWLSCYVFTRESIERAVRAKIEHRLGRQR